jgi:hypothetical protein
VFGRTLFVLVNLLAACALAALAAGSALLVYIGVTNPPPYGDWARQGVWGVGACAVAAIGLLLWALLAASALIWLVRSLRRTLATFAPVRHAE